MSQEEENGQVQLEFSAKHITYFHSIKHIHVHAQHEDHNINNEKFTYNFSLPKLLTIP